MKRLDYKTSRMVDFQQLYAFLNTFIMTCQNERVKTLFYVSESMEQLQMNIQDDVQACEFFFRKLKRCADQADHYIELEKFVVYMDLLLGTRYPPFNQYKKNLLKVILSHIDHYFTSDEYCVIRHLIPFQQYSLDTIIKQGQRYIEQNNEANRYFACEIYLIEGQYKQALSLVNENEFTGILLDYQEDLLRYKRKKTWQQLWKPSDFVHYQQRYA
ncbi:hypothetical protein [Beduini massiliensis]|uniref:hypothetical protein n=1 Tax=Beduini massiliensis TaxID=1585974 RepID=UPI00059A85EC|nr:hypothetical protein [Beduini massiliensis]